MARKKGKNAENEDDIVPTDDVEMTEDVELEDLEEHSAGKLKKLRDELKACQKERSEYLEGWQRAKADLVNAKSILAKEKQEILRNAGEHVATDLLPVLDTFDMAFANKELWESVEQEWRVGIEHIHTQLLSVLESHNVLQFDPTGETFDPALHDSVELIATNKKGDDNKILEVLQKGYKFGEKVIRPAKVKVGQWKE